MGRIEREDRVLDALNERLEQGTVAQLYEVRWSDGECKQGRVIFSVIPDRRGDVWSARFTFTRDDEVVFTTDPISARLAHAEEQAARIKNLMTQEIYRQQIEDELDRERAARPAPLGWQPGHLSLAPGLRMRYAAQCSSCGRRD